VNDKTKLGLNILGAALVLGVLGDGLLRATPWGVNVLLWVGALLCAVIAIVRWRKIALSAGAPWLILPAINFAAGFVWCDSPTLKVLDGLVLFVTLSLAVMCMRAGRARLIGVMQYALGVAASLFHMLFGPLMLILGDIQWKEIPRDGWARHAIAAGRGFAITLPLLLIFNGLLMSADAVFENIVSNVLRMDFDRLVSHIFLSGLCAWLVGGLLRGMFGESAPATASAERQQLFSLGIVEIGIVLGLLDLLFLGFVIVQFRYFFGGAAMVESTAGLTYAEYARRGFFELVAVAALVLPLLLFTHWLLRKGAVAHERIFRALAGAQILMLFIIMASAFQRMRLYQSEYGLTQLRLYTTAFMCWLAIVFIWFAVTVLRGRRDRFASGALASAFVAIAALHLLNPDAFIVRTNVAHIKAGRNFDARYAASLSADAAPELIAALPELSQQERCLVASRVLERWSPPERAPWRTWNWSRARAWQAVRENERILKEAECK